MTLPVGVGVGEFNGAINTVGGGFERTLTGGRLNCTPMPNMVGVATDN